MSNQALAGMAWTDIAASAYRAYAASTGNKNFRGEPMPAFDALPLPIKTAWEAAVRQADECLRVRGEGPAPDEQHWNGWVRPQDKGRYAPGQEVEVIKYGAILAPPFKWEPGVIVAKVGRDEFANSDIYEIAMADGTTKRVDSNGIRVPEQTATE